MPTFTIHSLQSRLLDLIANADLAVNVASEEDRGSDGSCGSCGSGGSGGSGSGGGGEFLAVVTVAVASAKYRIRTVPVDSLLYVRAGLRGGHKEYAETRRRERPAE